MTETKKQEKKLRMPRDAAAHHIGLLPGSLALCKSIVKKLKKLREEGINDWDYDAEEYAWRLAMIDDAIAEWQKGADRTEAEMEFRLLSEYGEGRKNRIGAFAEYGDDYKLLSKKGPRVTTEYAKALKAFRERKFSKGGRNFSREQEAA